MRKRTKLYALLLLLVATVAIAQTTVITNVAPGADFTITQNSVAAFKSVAASAAANTLVLNAGKVATGAASPRAVLDVTNGSANTAGDGVTDMVVTGANNAVTSNVANVSIQTNTTQNVDVGGSVGMGGRFGASTDAATFAEFKGAKENGTANNLDGYFVLATRKDGVGLVERMRISSTGHISSVGTAPACTFSTGGGTSPSCALDTGSTDNSGIIILTTGSGSPGSTGTVTLTFVATYITNMPTIVLTGVKGASAWATCANFQVTTESLTAPVFTWSNFNCTSTTGVTLGTATTYKIAYHVIGKT